MVATLDSITAKLDVWDAVVRDAEAHIAKLCVERVLAVAADRHPNARFLDLRHDAEGYFISGMFAADGRDLLDGTEDIDGIDPDNALIEAISALPSGAVAYDDVGDARRLALPGGPPRCTVCGRTEAEDDSCPDDIYGRHAFE